MLMRLPVGSDWLALASIGLASGLLLCALALPMTRLFHNTRRQPWTSSIGSAHLLVWLERILGPRVPGELSQPIRRLLRRAGLPEFIGPGLCMVLTAALAMLAVASIAVLSHASSRTLVRWPASPLTMAFATVVAASSPWIWLVHRCRDREWRLSKDLPLTLELIAMSVRAGSPLMTAIEQSMISLPVGPLRDELNRVLLDVNGGRTRTQALQRWRDRCPINAVRDAAAAMITGDRHGADLSGLLIDQAAQRRDEQFALAERQAMQAPVKLLLPLLVFIFPGTLLIVLYPVAIRLLQSGLF